MVKRPLDRPRVLRWQLAQLSANSFDADFPASRFSCAPAAVAASTKTAASASRPRPVFTIDMKCVPAERGVRRGLIERSCMAKNRRRTRLPEHDQESGYRFSLRQTRSVCAEIMLKQKDRARWRFEENHPALT